MKYLYLRSSPGSVVSFPCDIIEIKYALRETAPKQYMESWPGHGHGHGPEWRMLSNRAGRAEYGAMVLDLEDNGRILTIAELGALGVEWSE